MDLLYGRRFDTLREAREAIDSTAKDAGYSFVIQDKRSSTTNPRVKIGTPISTPICATHRFLAVAQHIKGAELDYSDFFFNQHFRAVTAIQVILKICLAVSSFPSLQLLRVTIHQCGVIPLLSSSPLASDLARDCEKFCTRWTLLYTWRIESRRRQRCSGVSSDASELDPDDDDDTITVSCVFTPIDIDDDGTALA